MITLKEALLKRGIAADARGAESLIMSGSVRVGDRVLEKPGIKIKEDAEINIIESMPYVSRGALKLKGAFEDFKLDAKGKKIIDAGASTGGFTDFLLQEGASGAIAIDVGYGILSWKLRNNAAVTVMERTNIKNLDMDNLPYLADLAVVDVSFISVRKVFEKILLATRASGEILLLIKPQFEAERRDVEEKGVIKNRETHRKVLSGILEFLQGFECAIEGLSFSKIRGAKGNQEYWVYLRKNSRTLSKNKKSASDYDKIINDVLNQAESFFKNKKSN